MKHELTFTLKPYLYAKPAIEQFRMTKQDVLDILKPYKHTTVCELTSTNNVHYHSLLEFDGIVEKDKLLNRIRPYKQFGKPHCTAVQYEESYENYLMKDIVMTQKIINNDPLIKDDYKLRPIPKEIIFRVSSNGQYEVISKQRSERLETIEHEQCPAPAAYQPLTTYLKNNYDI